MRFHAKIEVRLKPGHSDPEGEMTWRSLKELNYSVKSVGVGKIYSIIFEASSKREARGVAEEMCRRLLANPTKDDYRFQLEETE
jgi:phosphoribosylformylglycinamidine synthase